MQRVVARGIVVILLTFATSAVAPRSAFSSHQRRDTSGMSTVGSGKLRSLGPPLPNTATTSLVSWKQGGLIYGEAIDPHTLRGTFTVWRIRDRKLIFKTSNPEPTRQRKMLVDNRGNVYYSSGYALAKYDPRTNRATLLPARFAWGGVITAATQESRAGLIYGVTERRAKSEFPHHVPPAKRKPLSKITNKYRIFSFNPTTQVIRQLGIAWDFTTAMTLDPSERYLYTAPGAHGTGWKFGAPLLRLDLKTKQVEVVAFLNDFYEKTYGYTIGGAYGLQISRDGRTIYISMNASRAGDTSKKGFGSPAVMVVHLPKDTRPTPLTSARRDATPAPPASRPTRLLSPGPAGTRTALTDRSPRFVAKPAFLSQPSTAFRIATVPPAVDFLPYPTPYRAPNWSSWAPGVLASDGIFYSAVGDHRAPDGNTFIYGYDPNSKRLFLVGDAASAIPHTGSNWGYGKIHAGFVEYGGQIYTVSYWGGTFEQFPTIEFGPNFRGSEYLAFPLQR